VKSGPNRLDVGVFTAEGEGCLRASRKIPEKGELNLNQHSTSCRLLQQPSLPEHSLGDIFIKQIFIYFVFVVAVARLVGTAAEVFSLMGCTYSLIPRGRRVLMGFLGLVAQRCQVEPIRTVTVAMG
jgi:hypothetical protein